MKSKIQNPKSKIAIVGAGPSGASLAIRLAKENFEVVLIEREKFPRQKLCGEFISPECLAHFRQLGVLEELLSAGGARVTETVFYAPNGKSVSVPSRWFDNNLSVLSLSRAEMDFRLLNKAKDCGVEVLEESQVTGLLQKNGNVSGIKVRKNAGETKEISADFIIDATGRARILSKLAEKTLLTQSRKDAKMQRTNDKGQRTKLIGFKTHLENVKLEKGRCEIYFFRGGYGGLSYVENELANHCFLIEADIVKEFSGNTDKIVQEVIFQNKRARSTLKDAKPVNDWLAVSIDGFGARNLNPLPNLFTIGDAAAFIDPFTGSGMLMALESAEILAKLIKEKHASPEIIAETYKLRHRRKFQKRLRICSLLRRLAYVPSLAGLAISALSLSEKLREILARATRQNNFEVDR